MFIVLWWVKRIAGPTALLGKIMFDSTRSMSDMRLLQTQAVHAAAARGLCVASSLSFAAMATDTTWSSCSGSHVGPAAVFSRLSAVTCISTWGQGMLQYLATDRTDARPVPIVPAETSRSRRIVVIAVWNCCWLRNSNGIQFSALSDTKGVPLTLDHRSRASVANSRPAILLQMAMMCVCNGGLGGSVFLPSMCVCCFIWHWSRIRFISASCCSRCVIVVEFCACLFEGVRLPIHAIR